MIISREVGGAALVAFQLAAGLRRRGRPQIVWVPGAGAAEIQASRAELPTKRFDSENLFSSSRASAARSNLKLAYQLRRHGRGIAHVHSPHLYGAMSVALKLSGLARVVHVHIAEDPNGLRWAFKSVPDLIITCARSLVEAVRESLPERLRRDARVEAVPNPVDTDRFFPAADRLDAKRLVGAPLDRPLLLMLANLAPHKGQETAIRAIAELARRGHKIACWLAGEERRGATEYTARLQQMISSLDLDGSVLLLGSRSDAPDLLRAADAFLLPSTHEGLPLSILEAQASGVPVLAAPTAGIPEVVRDGVTGFLIPADDSLGYARRLETLIGKPALLRQTTNAALRLVRSDYSLSAYVDRICQLYSSVADRSTRSRGIRSLS